MEHYRTEYSAEFDSLELVERVIVEMDKMHTPIHMFSELSKPFDTSRPHNFIRKTKTLVFLGFHINLWKAM